MCLDPDSFNLIHVHMLIIEGSVSVPHLPLCVFIFPYRNMRRCSSVWMPPLCLKKSYAMPNPFHSSDTAPDLLCKYKTHKVIYIGLCVFMLEGSGH